LSAKTHFITEAEFLKLTEKEIAEILVSKKLILKKQKNIELAKFTKSRSLQALFGVDLKNFNELVFFSSAKSRFLLKNAQNLENLANLIAEDLRLVIKKRTLFYSSEICSKSVKFLKEAGWKLYDLS